MPNDKTINKDNTDNPEPNSNARKGYSSEPINILTAQKQKRANDRDLTNRGFRVASTDKGINIINTDTNYNTKMYQHFLGDKYDYLPNWSPSRLNAASAKEQNILEAIGTLINPPGMLLKGGNRIIRDVERRYKEGINSNNTKEWYNGI